MNFVQQFSSTFNIFHLRPKWPHFNSIYQVRVLIFFGSSVSEYESWLELKKFSLNFKTSFGLIHTLHMWLQVDELISNTLLNVDMEEKVYTSVINWVKHEPSERKKFVARVSIWHGPTFCTLIKINPEGTCCHLTSILNIFMFRVHFYLFYSYWEVLKS